MTVETANRLYELRKKHNLSQEELAERLGVSRQAVSKWERSEASPDTDNLIALAKIYGLSLDELVYGERASAPEHTEANAEDGVKEQPTDDPEGSEDAPEENDEPEEDESLLTVEDGGNKVTINPSCILVEDEDGDTVKIGFNGIRIERNKSPENSEDGEAHGFSIGGKGHFKINVEEIKSQKTKFWLEAPFPIICLIAYLIFGFYDICGGWALSWIIFVTIPIYYTLVEAIYKRRFSEFAYPVLTALIYLYLGLYQGNWHPSWIIFVTIPVYYSIAEGLDRLIRNRKRAKE